MQFRASLANTHMNDVIYEMSRKGLGVTAVVEGDKLLGIISDGDLRRLARTPRQRSDGLDCRANA